MKTSNVDTYFKDFYYKGKVRNIAERKMKSRSALKWENNRMFADRKDGKEEKKNDPSYSSMIPIQENFGFV